MIQTKNLISTLFIIYLLMPNAFLFAQAQNEIDVLKLKNGDVIKGKIIENKINKHIRIELLGGSILTYEYDKILEIEREMPNKVNASEQKSKNENLTIVELTSTAELHAKEDYEFIFKLSTASSRKFAFNGAFCSAFINPFYGGALGMLTIYLTAGKKEAFNPSRLESVFYNDLNAQQKEHYENTYRQNLKVLIRTRHLVNGGIGTFVAWALLYIISNDSSL